MYLTRQEVIVTPGRAAEFEASWVEHQQVLRDQQGFRVATLFNSLGYPYKYTALIRFETREDWQASQNSAVFQARLHAQPEGLIVSHGRLTEAYELIHLVGPSEERSTYGRLVEWNLDPGRARAFEDSRGVVFELRQKYAPGFVVSGLWRFLGNRNRYLGISGYTGNEDRAHPEIAAFDRAHPYSEYASTPPEVESYAIVQRVHA